MLYRDSPRIHWLQGELAISLPKLQEASREFTWGCTRPGTEELMVHLLISIGLSISQSARSSVPCFLSKLFMFGVYYPGYFHFLLPIHLSHPDFGVRALTFLGHFSHTERYHTMETTFPHHFQWGIATSAHQVEGCNFHNDSWLLEHT